MLAVISDDRTIHLVEWMGGDGICTQEQTKNGKVNTMLNENSSTKYKVTLIE